MNRSLCETAAVAELMVYHVYLIYFKYCRVSGQGGTFLTPEHILDPEERVNCKALGGVLSLIGDKWTIMIVGELAEGPVRFNELKRRIGGITQRMLTLALRRLEQEGLVARTVFPTVPPQVDYRLTDHGRTLIEPLRALGDWAGRHYVRRQAEEMQDAERGSFQEPRSGNAGE